MNDSRDPRTKLLADALSGNWADGPAAAMAQRAAAHARRRQFVRRTAIAACAAMVLAAAILLGRHTPSPIPASSAPVAQRAYEIISDGELETLLRDRPLLVLPQENGVKKFVLLAR